MIRQPRQGRSQRPYRNNQPRYPAWLYNPFAELVWLVAVAWSFSTGNSHAAYTMIAVKAAQVLALMTMPRKLHQ